MFVLFVVNTVFFCVRSVQRFWTTLHQFHERKAPAVFQSPYVCARARRVSEWRHRLGFHRLWHGPPCLYWIDRKGKVWPASHGSLRGCHTTKNVTTTQMYILTLTPFLLLLRFAVDICDKTQEDEFVLFEPYRVNSIFGFFPVWPTWRRRHASRWHDADVDVTYYDQWHL